MKVIRGFSTDRTRSVVDPLLERNGIFIELRGGNVCTPLNGDWFGPVFPTRVWRWFCRWPVLPFVAWRWGGKGGYVGFKAYGADSLAYLNWMPIDDVYTGSQALCLSVRPFATMKD